MRKQLNFFSGIGIVTISGFFVVSCDWKTPPLSVQQLDHIFTTVKNQVYEEYKKNDDIPVISNTNNVYKMPWDYVKEGQNNETVRIWTDKIISVFTSKMTASDTGNINQGLNIFNGQKDSNFENEQLKINFDSLEKVQSYYFTARINDIQSESGNWLSTHYKNSKNPIKINNENIEIPKENKPKNEVFKEEKYYSSLDLNTIWGLEEKESMKSTNYKVRFLFTFSPNSKYNIDPSVFYVDMEMNR